MKTEQINLRLEADIVSALERVARAESTDRATAIRRLLEASLRQWEINHALDDYRRGDVSLGRAAEEADLTQWELQELLRSERIAYPSIWRRSPSAWPSLAWRRAPRSTPHCPTSRRSRAGFACRHQPSTGLRRRRALLPRPARSASLAAHRAPRPARRTRARTRGRGIRKRRPRAHRPRQAPDPLGLGAQPRRARSGRRRTTGQGPRVATGLDPVRLQGAGPSSLRFQRQTGLGAGAGRRSDVSSDWPLCADRRCSTHRR